MQLTVSERFALYVVYMREVASLGDFKLMASILQTARDGWMRCDPLLRMFLLTCLFALVWRVGIAAAAFPSFKLNFNDYIWMTKFFGMSDLLYVALVFSGFGLMPSFTSSIFFGCMVSLAAAVGFHLTRRPRLLQMVVCCTAIIGTTITIIISPSLETVAAQVLPMLIEGPTAPVWIPFAVEYAFGIILCLVAGRRYISDMSRQKRKSQSA